MLQFSTLQPQWSNVLITVSYHSIQLMTAFQNFSLIVVYGFLFKKNENMVFFVGVGKSSLLLRFSDNTFTGMSSLTKP